MPLYNYQCLNCADQEEIVGGLDDHVAHCLCGALMLRTNEYLFGPYFTEMLPPAPVTSTGFLKS